MQNRKSIIVKKPASKANVRIDRRLEALEKEKSLLQSQLEALEKDKSLLQSRLEALGKENSLLQSQLEALEKDKSLLQSRLDNEIAQGTRLIEHLTTPFECNICTYLMVSVIRISHCISI